MLFARGAIVLIPLIAPIWGGSVSGHAVITKRLTKKVVSPLIYNLRGAAPSVVTRDTMPENEYGRMVLILEGGLQPSLAPVTAVLDQKGVHFDNEILVVPVGSTVDFLNSDPIFHNVFSLSKTQPFDLGYYPRGQKRSVKFNRPGVVQVYCHIHANMYAAIVVAESPWFVKPTPDGSFSFDNVPPGHYRLTAWHKIAGFYAIDVTVPATGNVEANISVPIDVEHP